MSDFEGWKPPTEYVWNSTQGKHVPRPCGDCDGSGTYTKDESSMAIFKGKPCPGCAGTGTVVIKTNTLTLHHSSCGVVKRFGGNAVDSPREWFDRVQQDPYTYYFCKRCKPDEKLFEAWKNEGSDE